jgi:hypothetical protein
VTGTAVTFPPGRYGHRRAQRPRRRLVPALLLVLVLAASVGIAVKLFRQYGNPAYRADITSLRITDTGAVVVFRVAKPAGEAATCQVRARAYSGVEIARVAVDVPAGGPDVTDATVTYRFATPERPYAVDITRCAAHP